MPQQHLTVVLKGYPRLSETFIAQELLNLERSGISLTLFSLRHPTDKKTHPVNDEIQAQVVYLPEYLYQEPLRVIRSWLKVKNSLGFKLAWAGLVNPWSSRRNCQKTPLRFTHIFYIHPHQLHGTPQ